MLRLHQRENLDVIAGDHRGFIPCGGQEPSFRVKRLLLGVGGVVLLWGLVAGCSRPAAQARFADFTYAQVLEHFEYYHERSEAEYRGDGTWTNVEYGIEHPLVRDASRRAQGYMSAWSLERNPVYEARARAALDWLVRDQKPDGHFTWWNTPAGTDNRVDCQYTTAEGGAALAEGYATFGDARYLAASARAAEWEADCDLVWNTNYVMFAVWHLAKHYRITGEQRWLDEAVFRVVHCALPRQTADGSWKEGADAPPELVGHNQRIWYHAIILRGLIEVYRVLPADHPVRGRLLQSIEAGVRRAIELQRCSGEIPVEMNTKPAPPDSASAERHNTHRDAFILEALLLAHVHAGIETRDAIRGIMQYRLAAVSQLPPQEVVNIDVQAVGYLLQCYRQLSAESPGLKASGPGR